MFFEFNLSGRFRRPPRAMLPDFRFVCPLSLLILLLPILLNNVHNFEAYGMLATVRARAVRTCVQRPCRLKPELRSSCTHALMT